MLAIKMKVVALLMLVKNACSFVAPRVTDAFEPHVLRHADGQDVATLNPLLATSTNVFMLS